jgi:hypothetical protein
MYYTLPWGASLTLAGLRRRVEGVIPRVPPAGDVSSMVERVRR